ncbi:hypothetical protein FACS189429_1770 [Bacteroidia bacterium]|nr:hypothetical protein FACS189429_1770 [Bacteroidia bacterium]GHV44128.1 hypothetical protein FACS1894180_5090 [Bacteroidia bacterium]
MKKIKIYLMLLLLIITLAGVFYIDYKVRAFDMSYYHGKDNGLIVRLEWVCLMSGIYYAIWAKRRKIIFALLGIIAGFIAVSISYLFIINLTNLRDIFYHLLSVALVVFSLILWQIYPAAVRFYRVVAGLNH